MTYQEYMAALTTWVVALLALVGAYKEDIMFWLGFTLVVARLVQELPKAFKKIKSWVARLREWRHRYVQERSI